MNIEYEILKEHSKHHTEKIARWIGGDAGRFSLLMHIFLNGEYRIVQRTSWIVSTCVERHPDLAGPWTGKMLLKIADPRCHRAVKRNVLRLLQYVDIPRRLQGKAAALCFSFLSSQESPIAVKVFSMSVLARIALNEPDLLKELALIIEQMMPYESAGFQARGKKILRAFSKNQHGGSHSIAKVEMKSYILTE